MRVIFAGSPEIALPSLRRVAAEHDLVAVLTNPESSSGRGLSAAPTAIAVAARELGIPVLAFERLGSEARAAVATFAPEILVTFAYGRIFGPRFLALFPRGGLNVHPSLLPRWRGAAPIPQAILHRDRETGVSVQALALELDAGDLYSVGKLALDGRETTESLSLRAAELGAELLSGVLADMQAGEARAVPQVGEPCTCGLLGKEDGLIDWTGSCLDIDARIRAFHPWPGAFTWLRGQRLNLVEAFPYPGGTWGGEEAATAGNPPAGGQILGLDKARGLMVQTNDGLLGLLRLQLQTKKALPFREFANGVRELAGAMLGNPAAQESGKHA